MSRIRRFTPAGRACLLAAVLVVFGAPGVSFAEVNHAGAADPTTEGWDLGFSGVDVLVGGLGPDVEHPGVSSWRVQDLSGASGSSHFYAAPVSEIPGPGQSWHMRARLRVGSLDDAPDMGVFLEVTDPTHRRFLLLFGSDALGRMRLVVSTNGSATGSPNEYLIALAVPGSGTTEYVNVDLLFESGAASLFINGQQVASGIVGYTAASVPARVLWGAGSSSATGHGLYAEVGFELDPSPECSNGLDDDGDGLVDEAGGDPDCAGPLDPEERPPVVPCDDGVDSDSDGVCDVDELRLGTNAEQGDSDGDHLSDADEIAVHGTNPALADSDGDGFDDDVELAAGRDPVDPTSGPPPVPSWDYAMPSRFLMRDPMSPQQGGDQYFAGELHPTEWMVDFDACGTAGLVFEYRWFIDDVLVENRPDCSGFQHVFASEGPYDVRLVAIGTAGEQVEAEQLVVVDDLLIFGLGDSYGSGEGNPDQPITDGMLEDYQALLDELTSLQNAAGNAVAAWQAALAEFNDLIGRVNFAFARLGIWADAVAAREAACPFPVVGCSAALAAEAVAAADLVWALGNIGVEDWNVANLPSYQQIWDKIDGVRAAGQATYSLALAARDAAQAAVAAAQGAVDFAKGELVAVWQNEPCHRSAYSGQVLAAQQIELSDPHTSVTFVHVACSGAQIRSGGAVEGRGNDLIGDDDDPDGHIPLNRQVNWLRQLAQDRTVDGVFVSIGGNDAQFANLITTCITTEPCFDPSWTPDSDALDALGDICAWFGWFIDDCEVPTLVPPPGEDANSMYLAAKSQLEPRYESLHRWLEGEYPRAAGGGLNTLGRIVQPGRVFLTEYPDFTRDDAGDYCGWSPGDPIAVAAESLPGVSQPEHQWAGGIVAPDLRDEMQRNAELYGWNFVTGISDPFSTHGYCATDPWIIRVGESLATQKDESGIAHPDRNGHQAYATALTTAFLPEPGMGIGLGAGLLTLTWLERSRRRSRACCERGDAA